MHESYGEYTVECPEIGSIVYEKPLRVRKVNIGTKEKPKFAQIGDYLNDETMENIAYLLCKYQDIFPTTFSEMEGISGELGEMNVPLKPYEKPITQRPYRLNSKYKEEVKKEIDQMLEAGIIEPVVES